MGTHEGDKERRRERERGRQQKKRRRKNTMARQSLVKLMERVARSQRQKQQEYITTMWDGVSKVVGREEKRGGKIIKALARAEARAQEREAKPLLKVDKFTKQKQHKRERQMVKMNINEELRRMCY